MSKPIYKNDAEYFADHDRVSASMLSVFRKSRKLYHARFVARTFEQGSSARFDLGTACHTAVLEPDQLEARVAVSPQIDRRTKAGKAEWQEFTEANDGKLILKPDDFDTVQRVRDSVMACGLARQLVEAAGPVEVPVVWQDLETGLGCKAKPDKMLGDGGTIVDLKTTSDASEFGFSGSLAKFNYGIQAAHYLDGTGADRFVWVVVSVEPPHEVAVYELDAESMARARSAHMQTLLELSVVSESGEWDPQPTAPTKIGIPKWWL